MTLIKSISGIRGTIGGVPDEGLTPLDIVKFASAYGAWVKNNNPNKQLKIVIGRDARISGDMVNQIVIGSLLGMGIDVVDIGLSTTPTVEIAVPSEKAQGGIILTASHNPKQWNALKLLNEKGEFISGSDGEQVLKIAKEESFNYAEIDNIGKRINNNTYFDKHIKEILDLPLVNTKAIAAKNYKIVIDCVNSSGGIVLPKLLKALGVKDVVELYCTPNGEFPHNPEPLPEHLTALSQEIKDTQSDLGFVVDPDVDRLAIVCENGEMFGEEYTLVAAADYVLKHTPGNTVSNLSSTKALRDVTENKGGIYTASAVGEVNVVEKMKATNAVIGGEGNGGVIYPTLHYGRDALVGIALFLSHLATSDYNNCSALRASYPNYFISKNKLELTPSINVDKLLTKVEQHFSNYEVDTTDGVKIYFENEWVHLRKSNTEPIIRIYSESSSEEKAKLLANNLIKQIKELT